MDKEKGRDPEIAAPSGRTFNGCGFRHAPLGWRERGRDPFGGWGTDRSRPLGASPGRGLDWPDDTRTLWHELGRSLWLLSLFVRII